MCAQQYSNVRDPTPLCKDITKKSKLAPQQILLCSAKSSLYTNFNQTFYIYDQKFYAFLVPNSDNRTCLLNSSDYTSNYFILSRDHVNKDKISKCYTAFPTYIDAFIWLNKLPVNERNCYEVIPNGPQKPHFDIDISNEQDLDNIANDVINHITSAIRDILSFYNINYTKDNNLLIFSSHGEHKRSYHLIIDRLYHSDNKQAKAFYHLVINKLPSHLRKYVDAAVYSNNQNFRLIGNQKKNSGRIKILDALTTYDPSVIDIQQPKELRLFESSLITFVSGCELLPSFISTTAHKTTNIKIDDITTTSIINCFELSEFSDDFDIIDSNWNGISLCRKHPSYCPIHNRIHEHENAYLSLSNKGHVYFICRRDMNDSIYIGSINKNIVPSDIDYDDNQILMLGNNDIRLHQNHQNIIEHGENQKFEHSQIQLNINLSHYNNSSNIIVPQQHKNVPVNGTHQINCLMGSSNISINDNGAHQIQRVNNKDDLQYFINRHIIMIPNEIITITDFVETYKKYCKENNLIYTYTNDDGRWLMRDIVSINQNLRTQRKQIKGVRQRVIVGYQLYNTYLLKKIVVPYVPNQAPIHNPKPVILKLSKEDEYRNLHERLITKKLNSNKEPDESNILPTLESLVRGLITFCLIIKAVCGMGKTELLLQIPKDARILVVSGRKSLGRKQCDDFNKMGFNMRHYSQFDNMIKDVPQIVVQVDSLWKIRGHYDYLILDEFTYAEAQLIMFTKKKKEVSEALLERIRRTPKIIVADAYITDTTVDLFRRNREDVVIYENNYPKQQNKNYYIVENKGEFYEKIYNDIDKGKKLIIPCGSKEEADAIYEKLMKKYNGRIQIRKYTSDENIDIDVTVEWHVDVVIYTSVCEAGNSFIAKHFDKCYGYFTANSCPPESAAQMIFRARQLKDETIVLHVNNNCKIDVPYRIQNFRQMKEYLMDRDYIAREKLCEVIPMSYIDESIDVNHGYFHMYADIKYRELIGKRNYLLTLMRLLKSQGVQYGRYMRADDGKKELYRELINEIKVIKHDNKDKRLEKIVESPNINEEKAIEIVQNEKATKDEKYALIKYNIKKRYKIQNPNKDFIRAVDRRGKQHTNITICGRLSGIEKEEDKIKIMEEISHIMVYGEYKEHKYEMEILDENGNNKIVEVTERVKSPHIIERITNTERMINYKICMHLINMLRILGVNDWLKNIEIAKQQYESQISNINKYLHLYGKDINGDALRNNKEFSDFIKLYENYLGISIIIDKKRNIVKIENYWKRDENGIYRPNI